MIEMTSGDFSPPGPGWPDTSAAKRALREHPIGSSAGVARVVSGSAHLVGSLINDALATRAVPTDLEKRADYLESL